MRWRLRRLWSAIDGQLWRFKRRRPLTPAEVKELLDKHIALHSQMMDEVSGVSDLSRGSAVTE